MLLCALSAAVAVVVVVVAVVEIVEKCGFFVCDSVDVTILYYSNLCSHMQNYAYRFRLDNETFYWWSIDTALPNQANNLQQILN